MDDVVNSIFRFLLHSEISLKTEKLLKKYCLIALFIKYYSN